jgi:predicted dehydrogenase
VSIDLLESGMHVLVEKPMACNVQQCNEMIRASEKNKRVLAVGLMRRYSQASRAAKKSIENGLLGQIVSFDIRNGFSASKWPFASDFILRKESAGGGVLMDLGVHTIDQLLWWLGDYESFHYFDDNYGGIEADCLIKINLKSGAKGDIEISRTRDLRETAIIRGERAILEVALVKNFMSLKFIDNGFSIKGSTEINGEIAIIEQRAAHLIKAEHDDFIAAIRNGQSSSICGREGKRSIELIEACYRERRLLVLPWMNFHAERHKETVQ